MKRFFLLIALYLFASGTCLATEVLNSSGDPQLRFRGKSTSSPAWSVEERNLLSDTKGMKVSQPVTEYDDPVYDSIFSSLGDIWGKFKKSECSDYFDEITCLLNTGDSRIYYLMGYISEKGLGKYAESLNQASEWYTQALVYASDNPLLYSLASVALERIKQETYKKKRAAFDERY